MDNYKKSSRFAKIDWLKETTNSEFNNSLIDTIVGILSEDQFNELYETICTDWDLARDDTELAERTRTSPLQSIHHLP
jgi:hypothetical protein